MSEPKRALLATSHMGMCLLHMVYNTLPDEMTISDLCNIQRKQSSIPKVKKHIVSHIAEIEDGIRQIPKLISGTKEQKNYLEINDAALTIISNTCKMHEDVRMIAAVIVKESEMNAILKATQHLCEASYHFLKNLADMILDRKPTVDIPTCLRIIEFNLEDVSGAIGTNQDMEQVKDAASNNQNQDIACEAGELVSEFVGAFESLINATIGVIFNLGNENMLRINIVSQMNMVSTSSFLIIERLRNVAESLDDSTRFHVLGILITVPFTASLESKKKQLDVLTKAEAIARTVSTMRKDVENYLSKPKDSALQTTLLEASGRLWTNINTATNNALVWKIINMLKTDNSDEKAANNLLNVGTQTGSNEVVTIKEIEENFKPVINELGQKIAALQNKNPELAEIKIPPKVPPKPVNRR